MRSMLCVVALAAASLAPAQTVRFSLDLQVDSVRAGVEVLRRPNGTLKVVPWAENTTCVGPPWETCEAVQSWMLISANPSTTPWRVANFGPLLVDDVLAMELIYPEDSAGARYFLSIGWGWTIDSTLIGATIWMQHARLWSVAWRGDPLCLQYATYHPAGICFSNRYRLTIDP